MVKTLESQSDTPPLRRLVVRVKIPVEEPSPPPVRQPLNWGVLILSLVVVAVVLTWLGIRMFRSEPTPAPAATQVAVPAPVPSQQIAPVVSAEPPPKPAEPELKEVIPDVPRSARDTIRGTIRVSIRVIVDKEGNVLAATADEPGPSRYFERLSLEAARKWTFAPTDSAEQRVVLVRFYFKRTGTTARATSVQ